VVADSQVTAPLLDSARSEDLIQDQQ
jgi:hypothetical protein